MVGEDGSDWSECFEHFFEVFGCLFPKRWRINQNDGLLFFKLTTTRFFVFVYG